MFLPEPMANIEEQSEYSRSTSSASPTSSSSASSASSTISSNSFKKARNSDSESSSSNSIKKIGSVEVDQVGFSTLPEQVHRKSLKKGFEFTLLVVGDSGLGKSTLVNSLFMTDLYSERVLENVAERIKKTVQITTQTCELEEKGVRLKLTVVDTPGFGDSLNAHEGWKPIEDYIDNQFHTYYLHESGYGIDRKRIQDTRVHCCLYFIPPYVRGLRPIDVETIRRLQMRVNVVPVIAKADSLTKRELEVLKQSILNDLDKFQLKTYEFPLCDSDDDESFKKADEEIRNAIPFAVIGSNTVIESGSKRVRGRVYPWGIIDIESDSCDFTKLRTFICSSHMQDLKDLTHDLHYENYRTELIKSQSNGSGKSVPQSATLIRGKQITSDEADRLLQQKDLELKKMQELLAKMKMNMSNLNLGNQNSSGNGVSNSEKVNIPINQHHQSNSYNGGSNGHANQNGKYLTSFGYGKGVNPSTNSSISSARSLNVNQNGNSSTLNHRPTENHVNHHNNHHQNSNGHSNSNGHTNGHSNGHSNGHAHNGNGHHHGTPEKTANGHHHHHHNGHPNNHIQHLSNGHNIFLQSNSLLHNKILNNHIKFNDLTTNSTSI